MALVDVPGQVGPPGKPRALPRQVGQGEARSRLVVGDLDVIPALPDRSRFNLDLKAWKGLGKSPRLGGQGKQPDKEAEETKWCFFHGISTLFFIFNKSRHHKSDRVRP